MRNVHAFKNRFGEVGRKKGQREDAADIAFVEADCFRQSTLIRQFSAEDPVNSIVRPSYGANQ